MIKKHAVTALALAAALIQGCEKKSSQTDAPAGQKRLHLAFVANSPGEYWAVVNLGCDIAAQQLGNVDVDFRFPESASIEAQEKLISNLIAAGVDGIAISPIDADKQSSFLDSVAAKTLLICADSDAPQSKRVSYIGTDNLIAGTEAATLIKTALPQGGKVALFAGYSKAQNTKDRAEGIRRGLAGSNIEIVEMFEDGQSQSVAAGKMAAAVSKYPDLAGAIGLSGYHGPALTKASHSLGKNGKIKIVCFDDNSDTLTAIASGEIHGTIAQKPFEIGKRTIVHMANHLRGDKTQFSNTTMHTASRVLTKDNVEHYVAQQRNISVFLKDKAF